MTKQRMLLLFAAAGLILAAVIGIAVYQSHLSPSEEEITAVLTEFIGQLASGDMKRARDMLTEETRPLLRDPGTVLGKTVYRNLSLKSVDNIGEEGDDVFTADMILTAPDTLKIMATAGVLFAERTEETVPAEGADRLMEAIYTEILSRKDLPMLDQFCTVRLELRNGRLLINADEALQRALEGDSLSNSDLLQKIGQ